MSQDDFGTIDPNTKSGTALATDLNDWRTSVHTSHSGTTAPPYVVTGMQWADNTSSDLIMNMYDGADSIPLFQIDSTNNWPKWFLDADSDSYVTATADDVVKFYTGGTEAISIGADQKVTIGEAAISSGTVVTDNSQSYRNLIINGNFDVWQRGTSKSTAGYLADRWRTSVNGSTFVGTQQSFTVGQTDVPNHPTYYHRTVVTSSAGAANFCLVGARLRDVERFSGETVTLSFWAKADAAKDIAVEFAQFFGTGGSADVNAIDVTTVSLSTSWTKYTITATITSVSGKTITSDNYQQVNFWFDAGSDFNSRTNTLGQQSGTFDIAQVQLEYGTVATAFENMEYDEHLHRCLPYYWRFTRTDANQTFAVGAAQSTTVATCSIHFPRKMISAPHTFAFGAAASEFLIREGGSSRAASAISNVTTSADFTTLQFTTSGMTVTSSVLMWFGATAGSYLSWSAEL